MPDDQGGFFSESSEQSRVKATIVADYFFAWASIIIPSARRGTGKIGYIDLFAGPGRYDDGTKSTPLMILERAIDHPDMREMLVAMFNDAAEAHANSLEAGIAALSGIEALTHKPKAYTSVVDEQTADKFGKIPLIPTLAFIDPWGYQGLSLPLIHALLKDWGCDCVFFFNYNRINMGLTNPMVEKHMQALFGEKRLAELKARLPGLTPSQREDAVMNMLTDALADLSAAGTSSPFGSGTTEDA